MTLTELKELRDRVRGLTGPDREVDARLCVTFQYMLPIWLDCDVDEDGRVVGGTDTAPALTGSTDAALAFSEKVLPGATRHVYDQPDIGQSGCGLIMDSGKFVNGYGAEWEHAIIDATLTALIETME